MQGRHILN